MKFKIHIAFAFALCILFSVTNSSGAEKVTQKFPSASVPVDSYEFAPVVDDTEITHDFFIENKGTAPLRIEKVKTDWGCTTVSYTRQIPPGGEGKITIRVDTKGSGGKRLKKNITVHTNDKNNPKINLTITGHVEKFVTITPKIIRLTGSVGQQIKSEVKIITKERYPFKIIKVSAIKGGNIGLRLKEIKISKRKAYLLIVENLKKVGGRYSDTIYLKTDSKIKPEIKIRVYGNILETHQKEKK